PTRRPCRTWSTWARRPRPASTWIASSARWWPSRPSSAPPGSPPRPPRWLEPACWVRSSRRPWAPITEGRVLDEGGRPSEADRLTAEQRVDLGKQARSLTPLESQAEFAPSRGRDPIDILLRQAATRVPELVPIRHGRMLASPFAYYRGAAA